MKAFSVAPAITYGVGGDVSAVDIAVDAQLRPSFNLVSYGRSYPVALPVHGVHQVSNALAALAVAEAVGVAPSQAIAGLAAAALSPWRMELGRTSGGATIINDAYNANAISTAAALRSLAALPAPRKFAVLGVMAELGDRHDQDHQAMRDLCRELGIQIIAYQEEAYGVATEADFDAVLGRLGQLTESDAVLIKGSRVAGLENLAAELLAVTPES